MVVTTYSGGQFWKTLSSSRTVMPEEVNVQYLIFEHKENVTIGRVQIDVMD
jgi:hypothetical protein